MGVMPWFAALVVLTTASAALAEATTADLDELEQKPSGYWALTFSGGAAFPLDDYADTHDEALAAGVVVAYTGTSGLGIGIHAGYSPLPVLDEAVDGESTDNHVVHAALAPRFTLGKQTLRLFVGAGGGVLFEQAAARRTAAAALAQAGLELHILGSGGLTVGGSYVRTFAKSAEAQLATAHAGFVMTF